MLSYKKYITKCILGMEIVYVVCLFGGLIPLRSIRGVELHHALFETIPGFTWFTWGSAIWGAVLMGVFAILFGAYMVWMHNSSIENK